MKPTITEAQAEALCDRLVMDRFKRSEYKHTESAEAQDELEQGYEDEVWSRILRKYTVAG